MESTFHEAFDILTFQTTPNPHKIANNFSTMVSQFSLSLSLFAYLYFYLFLCLSMSISMSISISIYLSISHHLTFQYIGIQLTMRS